MSSVSQVLRQADSLKVTVSDSSKSIPELWVPRQRLEDLYKKLLLMDLEYALDKKVEQDLWNHAFKNQINILQAQTKDKQNTKRGESQASLNLFLENASGFYLQFLQLVCTTFKLDLPFRRKSSAYGVMKEKCPLKAKINPPTKNSCLYICQHCLVHLGDIARYRQQIDQAKTYYRHAANLVPQNGQPYNQMAILEAARGNKLLTVFYYIRSLDVRHPFPVAATNLEKFYTKLAKDVVDYKGKLSMTEVISVFLQFHALVHLTADLTKAGILKERLLTSLPAHITSQSFHTSLLLQFVTVTIFSVHHARNDPGEDGNFGPAAKAIQFCRDEEKSYELVFTFICGLLESLVQNTPKQEQKAREFFTLPAIKIILDWLSLNNDLISTIPSSNLWSHLAKLLNNIQSSPDKENVDLSKYGEQPLPEDVDLRCFRPIEKCQSTLSYSKFSLDNVPSNIEAQLRCQRLVAHGKKIAQELTGNKVLTCQTGKTGKLEFHSTVVAKGTPTQPSEKKSGRQNIAMQTIYQKHGQKMGGGDVNKKLEVVTTENTTSGQRSPKYILGIPTTEPQFMRHGGQGRLNQSQLPPRLQNQQNQQNHQQQQQFNNQTSNVTSPPAEEASLSPGSNYGYRNPTNMSVQRGQFQDVSSPPKHDSSPNHPPQYNMVPGMSPYQQEHFRMSSPAQGQGQTYSESQNMPPMATGQMRMPHMMPPNQNLGPMTPPPNLQLLNAIKMAAMGPNAAKGIMGMNQAGVPNVPGIMPPHMNYNQGSDLPPGPTTMQQRMMKPGQMLPNFPAFSNVNYVGTTPSSGGSRQPAPNNMPRFVTSESMLQSGKSMMAGYSPLTIQPPKQNIIDSRLTSTFQGHAEGTPKPENMAVEKREIESLVVTTVAPPTQPGVYSLFSSSTPWSVSLPTASDSKSVGSSPFSSAASSMRNSPEHQSDFTPGGAPNNPTIPSSKQTSNMSASPNYDPSPRFNTPSENWNQQVTMMMGDGSSHMVGTSSTNHAPPRYVQNNMQMFWTNQGNQGMSPLEKLLEMQKQRQNDPH
ncbi:nonsense-mediated mRNA decay factor SMG7 [Patella vulgata]|uniref:nonsense-mediated mRNA decay factor SMG7 n=1 Tax=Patella vulgata TaxID=6465 RepID=UPI0024A9FEE3|nr:nonsense-mediated mRNA decay factor SMG7 [Patella vulgata]